MSKLTKTKNEINSGKLIATFTGTSGKELSLVCLSRAKGRLNFVCFEDLDAQVKSGSNEIEALTEIGFFNERLDIMQNGNKSVHKDDIKMIAGIVNANI